MKTLILIIFAIFAIGYSKNVVELTDSNFDEVTRNGKWILEFFAPWCPHCQSLEPVLEEASVILKASFPELKIGSIDCTVQKGLAEKYGIEAYPTLKFLSDGYISDYQGGRQVKDFINFARRATGPSIQKIENENQLLQLKRDNPVIFILNTDNDEILNLYTKLSRRYQHQMKFATTSNKSIMKSIGNVENGLIWYSDAIEVYKGDYDEVDLEKWILERQLPIFTEINGIVWKTLEGKNKKIVVSAVKPENEEHRKFNEIVKRISLKNDKFVFGWINANDYSKFISRFLELSDLPHLFVIDPKNYAYWSNSSIPRNDASIAKFLDEVDQNLIAPRTAGGILNNLYYNIKEWTKMLIDNPIYGGLMLLAAVVIVIAFVALIVTSSSEDGEKEKEE